MLAVDAVKVTVVFVSYPQGGFGGGDALLQKGVGKGKPFLQNILFWGDFHFIFKQMADRGFGAGGVGGNIVQTNFFAQMIVDVFQHAGKGIVNAGGGVRLFLPHRLVEKLDHDAVCQRCIEGVIRFFADFGQLRQPVGTTDEKILPHRKRATKHLRNGFSTEKHCHAAIGPLLICGDGVIGQGRNEGILSLAQTVAFPFQIDGNIALHNADHLKLAVTVALPKKVVFYRAFLEIESEAIALKYRLHKNHLFDSIIAHFCKKSNILSKKNYLNYFYFLV